MANAEAERIAIEPLMQLERDALCGSALTR